MDGHPNNAWINGALDDVRIYRRTLASNDIYELYHSFDKLPPSVPTGLIADASASSVVTLRWSTSTDLFGMDRYLVLRDGVVIGETTNTVWFDTNLTPETTYAYAIQAQDIKGQISNPSDAVQITTRAVGGGVDLIVDDADGEPWTSAVGAWTTGRVGNTVLTGIFRNTFVSDGTTNASTWTYTFTPPIPESGTYSVYIWYPGKADATHLFSSTVPVHVVSGGVTNQIIVNQRQNIGQWRLLGNYALEPGAYVRINTAGTTTSHLVVGDAVRVVKP